MGSIVFYVVFGPLLAALLLGGLHLANFLLLAPGSGLGVPFVVLVVTIYAGGFIPALATGCFSAFVSPVIYRTEFYVLVSMVSAAVAYALPWLASPQTLLSESGLRGVLLVLATAALCGFATNFFRCRPLHPGTAGRLPTL